MVTDRFLETRDLPILEKSLAHDVHHQGTTADFFTQYGTVCKVFEDSESPILFVRGAKVLRLDIQFVSNEDRRRNARAMVTGFDDLAKKAKENGFTEIIFNSSNESLRKLCIKRFGFVGSDGELRRYL